MTRIEKNIRDGWQATTKFDLENNRVLIVTTMKRHDKTLATSATVHTKSYTDGVAFLTHAVRRDFYKTIVSESVRATEKTVAKQHQQVLDTIDTINDMIAMHYGEAVPA
jgi:hypothetical protein